MTKTKFNWRKYLYEFLTIFIGVTLAFSLSKWNEDRNRFESSEKTLLEIKNGLASDIRDFQDNMTGHEYGIKACKYFRAYLNNELENRDTIAFYYSAALLRDYISVQNNSGYESLKSKGLELIKNDSLRLDIISLYDFYYEIIEKMEEEYTENQFTKAYFASMNSILAEYMSFNENGRLVDLAPPVNLSKKEKNILMSYLWKIEGNREFMFSTYKILEEKATKLIQDIDEHIK